MERDIVDSSAAFTGNTIFPTVVDGKEAGAYILVTLVGDSEAELTAKMDRLGALAEQRGAYDTLVVWTDGLKKDVWAARSAFLTVIEADMLSYSVTCLYQCLTACKYSIYVILG